MPIPITNVDTNPFVHFFIKTKPITTSITDEINIVKNLFKVGETTDSRFFCCSQILCFVCNVSLTHGSTTIGKTYGVFIDQNVECFRGSFEKVLRCTPPARTWSVFVDLSKRSSVVPSCLYLLLVSCNNSLIQRIYNLK